MAATPNARYVEFFPDEKVFNFRELIDPQLQIGGNGTLRLPVTPGLGFGFAPDSLERRALGGWG